MILILHCYIVTQMNLNNDDSGESQFNNQLNLSY